MNVILLVFFATNLNAPGQSLGPNVSEKIFQSKQSCSEFVNAVAENDVVDENYKFKFVAKDNILFIGGCLTEKETEQYLKNKS